MKVLKVISVAILALGLFACEKESVNNISKTDPEIVENQAYDDLFKQLENYNSTFSFDASKTDSHLKGGFWDWLKFVAKCDGSGALIGGLAGGAVGMPGAGAIGGGIVFSLIGIISDNGNQTVDHYLNKPTYAIADNNVGVLHNQIIEEILKENSSLLSKSDITVDEVISIVGKKLEDRDILTTQELQKIFDSRTTSFVKEIRIAKDANVITNRAIAVYPELRAEIEVMRSYVDKVEINESLLKKVEYTTGVVNIVNKSTISVASKSAINSAASVYVNSSALWK